MATFRIPPLGFIGEGQSTLAGQTLTRQVLGSGRAAPSRRRKRKATRRVAARKSVRRVARRASSKGAKFVKGSPAAKRYMAKLRKMRKK